MDCGVFSDFLCDTLLGQKNTAIGIWMATTYLNPLASLFPALYSVWQNVFNSWQLWRYKKS